MTDSHRDETKTEDNQYTDIVGCAEVIGTRPVQEDVIAIIEPNLHFLSDPENAFKNAIGEVEQLYKNDTIGKSTGSCVLLAGVTYGNEGRITIHTANLGDSNAILLVANESGEINYEKSRLLNSLHNCFNQDEEKRALDECENDKRPLAIENGKIGGQLAVSRALGVTDAKPYGLSSTPECASHTVQLEPGETAYLTVACDGLLEELFKHKDVYQKKMNKEEMRIAHQNLALPWMGSVITEKNTATPMEIAKALIEKSVSNRETPLRGELKIDNISTGVIRLDPKNPVPLILAVLDGHGGPEVSQDISNIICSKLGELIEDKNLFYCGPENQRYIPKKIDQATISDRKQGNQRIKNLQEYFLKKIPTIEELHNASTISQKALASESENLKKIDNSPQANTAATKATEVANNPGAASLLVGASLIRAGDENIKNSDENIRKIGHSMIIIGMAITIIALATLALSLAATLGATLPLGLALFAGKSAPIASGASLAGGVFTAVVGRHLKQNHGGSTESEDQKKLSSPGNSSG